MNSPHGETLDLQRFAIAVGGALIVAFAIAVIIGVFA